MLLTHDAIITTVQAQNQLLIHYASLGQLGPEDCFLSYLPLAHIFDRSACESCMLGPDLAGEIMRRYGTKRCGQLSLPWPAWPLSCASCPPRTACLGGKSLASCWAASCRLHVRLCRVELEPHQLVQE